MPEVSKISSVAIGSIGKIFGIAKSSMGKFMGISAPAAYTNTYSIDLDGTNDYMTADGIFDDISVSVGTISMWIKLDPTGYNGVLIKADVDKSNQIGMAYLNSSRFLVTDKVSSFIVPIFNERIQLPPP